MTVRHLALAFAFLTLALPASATAGEPLAPAIAKSPGARPLGTIVLLPGSGWASPTLERQRSIWTRMAPVTFPAGYRTVAIDYRRGATDGLASVMKAVRTESRRQKTGPLCLYGESSGGHLALLAANRLRAVDCVITFGTPVSFTALADEVEAHPDNLGFASGLQITRDIFGADPAAWAAWDPANLRTPLRVPVLNMICADDGLVPPSQVGALPGAETYVAPAGDPENPEDAYVHGTISPAGKRTVQRKIIDFVERAGALSAPRS